jgi:hypothetical protein
VGNAWDWIVNNFNTLFSGLGVYAVGLIISMIVALFGFFFSRSKNSVNKVTIKNVSAGGDVVGRDKKGS